MNGMDKKKFGRSGGFKKRQKKLVKEIVKKYPIAARRDTIPVHEDVVIDQIGNIVGIACENQIIESHNCGNIDNICEQHDSIDNNPDPNNISASDTESPIEINILKEVKSKERDFVFNKIKFQSVLAVWAVENDIKHDQLRGLLKIWNEYVPLPALPIDPRTILETPQNVVIKDNNYWHRGLNSDLMQFLQK